MTRVSSTTHIVAERRNPKRNQLSGNSVTRREAHRSICQISFRRAPLAAFLAPGSSPASLVIRLFGSFHAQHTGGVLPRTRTQKEQWLLALLLLRHQDALDRRWLAGLFWPDSTEARALQYLRRSLSNLRDVLGAEAWRLTAPTPRTLQFDITGALVDALEFDRAIAQHDTPTLERAVEIYRGPLLQGSAEEWVIPEREAREYAYLNALETLAAQARARQDPALAAHWLRR